MKQYKDIKRNGKLFTLQADVKQRRKGVSYTKANSLESPPPSKSRLVYGKFYDDFSPIFMQLGEDKTDMLGASYSSMSEEAFLPMSKQETEQLIENDNPTIIRKTIDYSKGVEKEKVKEPDIEVLLKEEPELKIGKKEEIAVAKATAEKEAWLNPKSWWDDYQPRANPKATSFSKMRDHFHGSQSIDLGNFSLEKTFNEADSMDQ